MTTQLHGPFYVARYLPHDHRSVVNDRLSEHSDLAEAIINARRLTMHARLPLHPDHACVYVEHDRIREFVWVSV